LLSNEEVEVNREMHLAARAIGVIVLLTMLALFPSCRRSASQNGTSGRAAQNTTPLIVCNAGSLAAPFAELLREFAKRNPQVLPQQENSGSLEAVRKITELGKPCDLLAVADYEVIQGLMIPQHAEWYSIFARNQLVLMYTPKSKFAAEINGNNWFEILNRPGVQYGYSNPDLDPAGYRTLLHWRLAENYYHRPGLYEQLKSKVPAKNIRPKSVELVALLQSGELDYIYGYRSISEQNKLPFVTFPPEIDFSDMNKADVYATATVEVAGKAPGDKLKIKGLPILYALTIPKSAAHADLAEAFVEFVFSLAGQAIMQRSHLTLVAPPLASNLEKLPGRLKNKVSPMTAQIAAALDKR
jgi:molybdate/tungstate transport system substrate-binding protein